MLGERVEPVPAAEMLQLSKPRVESVHPGANRRRRSRKLLELPVRRAEQIDDGRPIRLGDDKGEENV
jgi:hypothetical protein